VSRIATRRSEHLSMPTPRAFRLEEPFPVVTDLWRPSSSSRAPPIRVRCRTAACCAAHRLSPERGETPSRTEPPHLRAVRPCRRMGGTPDVVSRKSARTLSWGTRSGCDPAFHPVHPFTTSPPSCATSRWSLDLVGSRSASRRTTPGDLVARSPWLVARASRRARPVTIGACDRRLPIHTVKDGHPRIVLFLNSRPRRPAG
jgi:hypothetical protein